LAETLQQDPGFARGSGHSGQAEDVGLRQPDRKNRQFDIFKWLKRK
jgi:hypothetical protein